MTVRSTQTHQPTGCIKAPGFGSEGHQFNSQRCQAATVSLRPLAFSAVGMLYHDWQWRWLQPPNKLGNVKKRISLFCATASSNAVSELQGLSFHIGNLFVGVNKCVYVYIDCCPIQGVLPPTNPVFLVYQKWVIMYIKIMPIYVSFVLSREKET